MINHDKTITTRYLNGSKLHLNKRGTKVLSNTFIESTSNIIHRQSILDSSDNYLIDGYNAKFQRKIEYTSQAQH